MDWLSLRCVGVLTHEDHVFAVLHLLDTVLVYSYYSDCEVFPIEKFDWVWICMASA